MHFQVNMDLPSIRAQCPLFLSLALHKLYQRKHGNFEKRQAQKKEVPQFTAGKILVFHFFGFGASITLLFTSDSCLYVLPLCGSLYCYLFIGAGAKKKVSIG